MIPETNLPWWRHDRPWGFRFSAMDAAIFLGGVVGTFALWFAIGPFALFLPLLLGHFFLFCNVFRIGGERSLIWVAAFLINVHGWSSTQNTWLHVAIQSVITAALIIQCVWSRNYHGFACERINHRHYREGAMAEGAFTRRVLLACRLPRPLIEKLVGRRLDEFDRQR